MRRPPTAATRSRRPGSGAARSGTRSPPRALGCRLGCADLVELDLVAEWIEHVAAAPARDRRRLLESHAGPPEGGTQRGEVADPEGEVPPGVQREVGLDGEMHLATVRSFEPEARVRQEGLRPRDLLQAELTGIERPGSRFAARQAEDLCVVEGEDRHVTECR